MQKSMATADDIARLRLHSQQIVASHSRSPAEVVHTLGAMQAQDYSAALWAIGLRLPGSTQTQIEQAIAERTIVRSWPMRGTLHFVAATDLRWMLQLLAPRVISNTERRDRQLDLDKATYDRCSRLLQRKLRGKQLQRDQVYQLLEKEGISTAGQRGYHILWYLAQQEVLCFGPQNGKQPTFALLDDWLPQTKLLSRDKALAELTLRYFSSHGPATADDFSAWSKLTLTDIRRGLEMVSERLQLLRNGKIDYWMAKENDAHSEPPHALLLPAFDEYLLGYRERSAILDAKHANKIVPGGNGVFRPIMVLHGKVVGTWKKSVKKTSVTLAWEPFARLKQADLAAFDREAERYAAFLELPLK